jgi:hypothetical protein
MQAGALVATKLDSLHRMLSDSKDFLDLADQLAV